MHIPRLTYAVFLFGAMLWCFGIVAAPAFNMGSLYEFYQRICHQLDSHSLHIAGEQLAVCARCSAIYFAFLFGLFCYPIVRDLSSIQLPSRTLLAVAALPMLLDVLFGLLGLHTVTLTTRMVTGSLFGIVLPFFLLPAAVGAVQEIYSVRQQTITPQSMKGFSDA
ncbi:MAG: DUF2085 domain-containing protein [Bacteroidota bacterium]